MKFCPQCRTEYEDSYKYCLKDGTPLAEADQVTSPTEDYDEKALNIPTSPPAGYGEETLHMPPEAISAEYGEENPYTEQTAGQPEAPSTQEQYGAFTDEQTARQTADEEIETSTSAAAFPPPQSQSKSRKSGILLLIGLLFGGLLLFGIALGGVAWWYLQNRNTDELALANSNSSNQNQSIFDENNSNIESTTNESSLDETFNDESNDTSIENSTNTAADSNAKPSPTASATKTPKPTPTSTREKNTTSSPDNSIETVEPLPPTRTPPPPTKTPPPVPKMISKGVVNGSAISLPKPAYPSAARAVRASGAVNVQVTIDENGNVISANAVSGHPLLRNSAVQAARRAKFSPTQLSGVPVKVSGVIVYNFVP